MVNNEWLVIMKVNVSGKSGLKNFLDFPWRGENQMVIKYCRDVDKYFIAVVGIGVVATIHLSIIVFII